MRSRRTGHRYKNGGIPDKPVWPVQCEAETRCTWCRTGRTGQNPAGTALSAHLSPGKHRGSSAFLQPLTPLAFWAVFAGQAVKKITFHVSKIHSKTIKGCMALQCIVNFNKNCGHLQQEACTSFLNTRNLIFDYHKIHLSLPIFFPMKLINFANFEDANLGNFFFTSLYIQKHT